MDIDVGLWGSIVLWNVVPGTVTSFLQGRYYALKYAKGSPSIPKAGQPKYARDRGWIYLSVVLLYLLYTLYQSVHSVTSVPNHYNVLSVQMGDDFAVKDLRRNWRKLSVMYHPDKNDDPNAEATYIQLRQAYETLNDPAKRLAYDRFGASVDTCKTCRTETDYVWQVGFSNFWTHHLLNGLVLFVIFFVLQSSEHGIRRWRVLLHSLAVVLEASLLFSGSNSGNPFVARTLGLTAYQQVQILRSAAMTVFVAIQHIHSVMVSITGTQSAGLTDDPKDLRNILETMEKIAETEVVEVRSLFAHSFDPFKKDEALLAQVRRRMEKLANEMRLYEVQEVREQYKNVRAGLKRTGKPVVPLNRTNGVQQRK
ncbi:hypothetical protein DFJ74DRAFT_694680 [Hyaloraphidium curvatum]|nr:hypothetical protein DFJ74DRAFT_694680 [Hyaloraphidium curvatum]